MSTLYNFEVGQDGSYHFTSDYGHKFKVYFFETLVPDSEGNGHMFLNFGFSRDDEHACDPFTTKYDGKIEATIIYILNGLFEKHDHRIDIFFFLEMTDMHGIER